MYKESSSDVATVQASAPTRRTSLWAVASLLCSLLIIPPLCLIGPVLGVVGLVQIRHGLNYRGRGAAIAGITLGLLLIAGWSIGAAWWHVNVRRPLLWGPRTAIQQGMAGDIDGFQAAFTGDGQDANDNETGRFLQELSRRYGRLLEMRRDDEAIDPTTIDRRRPRLVYLLRFERRSVVADVQFADRSESGTFVRPRFQWITLRDPVEGDLAYPLSALPVERPGQEADNQTDE
jgi:hypothetical protein